MKDNILISTWWFNKALLYSIIIPGVSIGFYKHGLNSSFLWLVGLFLCVHLILFSFKIELQTERLTYWRWPKYLSKGIVINRANIIRIENVPLSYGRKIKLAIFDVYLNGNDKPIRINLGAFSPKNVRRILDWLGYNQKK
jgi:hypothetical protein